MKAVIVIDIPNDIDINKMRIGGDGNIYYIRDGESASIVGNIKNIKPLPQKKSIELACKKEDEGNEYGAGLIVGWNDCLREITE